MLCMQIESISFLWKPLRDVEDALANKNLSLTGRLSLRSDLVRLAMCTFADSAIHGCAAIRELGVAVSKLDRKVALVRSWTHLIQAMKLLFAAVCVPVPALIHPAFALTSYRWMGLAPTSGLFSKISHFIKTMMQSRVLNLTLAAGLAIAAVVERRYRNQGRFTWMVGPQSIIGMFTGLLLFGCIGNKAVRSFFRNRRHVAQLPAVQPRPPVQPIAQPIPSLQPPAQPEPVPQLAPAPLPTPQLQPSVFGNMAVLPPSGTDRTGGQNGLSGEVVASISPQEALRQRVLSLQRKFREAKETFGQDYDDLLDLLEIPAVAKCAESLELLNELYNYRSLVHRFVTNNIYNRKIQFQPSHKTLTSIRERTGQVWDQFLKTRSAISNTNQEPLAYENWKTTERDVAAAAKNGTSLSLAWFSDIHKSLCTGISIPFSAGEYRKNGQDVCTLAKKSYVLGGLVTREVQACLKWIHQMLTLCDKDQNNIARIVAMAARSAQWLVSIHPFGDANGRFSRLVMDYILQRYGILPPMCASSIRAVVVNPDLPPDHAYSLVWEGIHNSYRHFGLLPQGNS
jgi:fido (protein-threonine AMPylation protein)